MEKDRASLTALRVAMSRAEHQLLDDPKVLDDPIAVRIVGAQSASGIRAESNRFTTKFARHLRAFVVARSRVAEDELADAVKRGVHQYVVLGAGLDTFAYRNPYPASVLRVFEVDHPDTQAWKQKQLDEAQIAIPDSLTFVAVDFESQTLADRLQDAGFKADEPAFFSWLGVTMYLTRETVMATMQYIASRPRGSGIVFDYVVPSSSLGLVHRLALRALTYRVAAVREPWRTYFDPQSLVAELGSAGFARAEDIGPEEINMRLFANRENGLKVSPLAHLMKARV